MIQMGLLIAAIRWESGKTIRETIKEDIPDVSQSFVTLLENGNRVLKQDKHIKIFAKYCKISYKDALIAVRLEETIKKIDKSLFSLLRKACVEVGTDCIYYGRSFKDDEMRLSLHDMPILCWSYMLHKTGLQSIPHTKKEIRKKLKNLPMMNLLLFVRNIEINSEGILINPVFPCGEVIISAK